MYACMHVCMSGYMSVCMSICMSACLSICLWVTLYVCHYSTSILVLHSSNSCGHDCCKHGIPIKPHTPVKPLTSASRTPATVGSASTRTPGPVKEKTVCKTHCPADKMSNYVSQLHAKATNLPATPALNRIKVYHCCVANQRE